MTIRNLRCSNLIVLLTIAAVLVASAVAADQPHWGQKFTRNMISTETNLPATFDPQTGANIKWTADLGSETWGTPIIASGRVLLGTNNSPPRDPRHKGDRGILICLDEKDGSFLWQLVVPKLGPDPYLDWPRGGIVSPPTIEDDRIYVMTNRGELVCLDMHGQSNGNDGPYKDEGRHMALDGKAPMEVTAIDADIIWLFDIPNQAGTYPHDAAHASPLIDGDFIYVNTSNGVDNTHRANRKPEGPSLIVIDKHTGRYLARDDEKIGDMVFHSTWSSPALGVVNGQKRIFFGGGDGVLYGFQALEQAPPEGEVATLERLWRFDGDPNAPKENIHEYKRNREVSPSNIKSMPVFHSDRIYLTLGGDIWWGKNKAWLQCIDAAKTGDTTEAGPLWSRELNKHCVSTPAVYNGMVFVADCGGFIHCFDAETGRAHWTHDADGEIWASTLVADGKVYVGTRRKDFYILAAAPEKKVLAEIELDSASAATPTAANGVVYVTSMHKLYAVALDK